MTLEEIKKKAVGRYDEPYDTAFTYLGDDGKLKTHELYGGILGPTLNMQHDGHPEREFEAGKFDRNWVSWRNGTFHKLHVGDVIDVLKLMEQNIRVRKGYKVLGTVFNWGCESGRQLWKGEGFCVSGSGYLFESLDDAKLYVEAHLEKHADQVNDFINGTFEPGHAHNEA